MHNTTEIEDDEIYESIYMQVVELVEKDNISCGFYKDTANKLKDLYVITKRTEAESNFDAFEIESIAENERVHQQIWDADKPEELRQTETVEAYERYADTTTDQLTRTQQERNKLQEEVERLSEEWISVKDRLPELYEPGISIIVNVTDGKRVTCGYYDFEEKQWNGYGFHSEKGTHITNWKYLPQPPNKP